MGFWELVVVVAVSILAGEVVRPFSRLLDLIGKI